VCESTDTQLEEINATIASASRRTVRIGGLFAARVARVNDAGYCLWCLDEAIELADDEDDPVGGRWWRAGRFEAL
jgi:hypothetical protein